MEEAADLEDWELLSPHSADDPKAFEGLDGGSDSYDGAIKSDYFALDSEKRRTERASSEEESEEGGVDSDNPSWVDPDSDPKNLERSMGKIEFRGSGFPIKNSGGFWSDESSDCRSSPADSEREEYGNRGDSVMEVGVEGIKTGYLDSSDDDSEKTLDFGRSWESEEIDTGLKEHGVEESGGLVKMRQGSGSSESVSSSEGEKRGVVWWKMPLEFIKFYVFNMRPVWSISIAAAIMGLFMLGRKLYKMKHKSQRIKLKIAFDYKVRFSFVLFLII
ncbi:ATG8-interacting protein 2 [Cocos nucifera]|nr:ATG8-interacting protein 2 [Cocos nucifera]